MLRYLIDTPQMKLPSYAVMMWLGAIAFVLVLLWLVEKREGTDRRTANQILVIAAMGLAVLYGSAFLFNSLFQSIEAGRPEFGGITWLGGVLGAFPVTVLLLHFACPRIKGRALSYFELFIPPLTLGHALGRVGCFLGGCCYGRATDLFLGVQFPHLAERVFPTQLYEAIFELLLFALMMLLYRRLRHWFLEIYLFGYGGFRFLLEFLRGDDRGATGLLLSPSQLISLIMILAGVLLILYKKGIIFKKWSAKMEAYRVESSKHGVHLRSDVRATLRRLKGLQKDGLLTEAEYEAYRTELEQKLQGESDETEF